MKIDEKFAAAIAPLSTEEYTMLEENVVRDGCRDPFVVWEEEGILLDGHNRKRICDVHELDYPDFIQLPFPNREAAADWIDANQLGRRNLNPDARSLLRGRRYNRLKKPRGGDRKSKGKSCTLVEPTADTLAEEHGVSPRTIKNDAKFADAVDEAKAENPDIEQQVVSGEVKKADVIRDAKRKDLIEKLEDTEAQEVKATEGVYDAIVIDPPWPMQKIERDCRPNQVGLDYPTMSEEELAALSVPCAIDCHVWLWTTHKQLPVALRLLDAWGLKYVCAFAWHKPGGVQPVNLPQYNCEFAIYARRGSPQFIDTKQFFTCFEAPRGAHSEKPEAFYEVVRRVTAGRRLDMFNRRTIEGFDGWGQEAK